ncbi:cbb3-type cytochrome oxidase assembly protein CcoS [uncultured Marinobacter sp.]|uniref:cbb3-type cytochrome oxidase assembly protein CcoS n=1 Tax=uncultured Marinobacter sp. TaxID=187379 RepID=UPI0026108F18|nr:cbb3-type cytochrome oxidase assembly protein CcoS [uncultured Marinobacter sp.]
MEVVVFLIPIMLILVVMGIFLFSWAVKNGQYDDLEGPAHRILYDDDLDMIPEEARTDKQKKAADSPSNEVQVEDGESETKPDRT